MQYDHIVILRTRLKSAARQTKCHQQAVSSGGGRVGAVRVQRESLGGQWRRREKLRGRRGRLYCPGKGPGRPPVRTRAPQPPPACAPLSGSPRPASAAAGCLLLSRLHASGAQPSLGLALVLGRVRKARSHCTDKLYRVEPRPVPVPRAQQPPRCTSGASGSRREASARVARGKGCPGGWGFIPPFSYSPHIQAEMESGEGCGADEGASGENGAVHGPSP